MKKKEICSVFREISLTKQMKYDMVPLYYGNIIHISIKIRKKHDDYEDFFVSVLVDHLADMPIHII